MATNIKAAPVKGASDAKVRASRKPAADVVAQAAAEAAAKDDAPVKRPREVTEAKPRLVHVGEADSTYRTSGKLTPLRTDYKAKSMTAEDDAFVRDVVKLAGRDGTFQRRNIDAGRLGRLFTFQMVRYDETGIPDPAQIIHVLPKAREYVKPLRGSPGKVA